jgi:hypothetical protein
MQNLGHMKTTTLPSKDSTNRASCSRALLLIPFAFACFGLSPIARAVCEQGCLKNDNTVLGDNALLNKSPGAGRDGCAIGAASRSAYCRPTESERTTRTEQTCTANG